MYLCRSSWFLSFCSCSPNHFWRRRRGSIGPKVGNGNVSAPGPSSFREIRIMFQLQAPPAFAYRSAGGSAAVGGSAAAAWQRRRFGVSSAFAYRSAYRSAYPGTYPCLSQVTDIISMEVPVSQLLAFQTHVTPQLLVLLPLSFSVIKCFFIFFIFILWNL